MKNVALTNGNVTINFNVFPNGNAVLVYKGNLYFIEDFAERYIDLRENGYYEV